MSNQNSFQNQNLEVFVEKKPKCAVQLQIRVSPQATAAAREKAVRNISKEVSLPGFRKGKAPIDFIEKNFDKSIEKEWKQILTETSLLDAIHLTQLHPYRNNSIKSAVVKEASLEEGATLAIEYEASPDVPTIDSKQLQCPPVNKEPLTEQMMALALEDLCMQHAEWNEVTDRGVEEGDFVELDIEVNDPQPRIICTHHRFQLAEGKIDPWLRPLLKGAEKGAQIEAKQPINSEQCKQCEDGSHSNAHEETYRITLHGIMLAKIPPFDDELAKKFGSENSEQLKTRVVASLEKQLEERHVNAMRSMMQAQLLEKYPFELPASITADIINSGKKKLLQDLRTEGVEESKVRKEADRIQAEAMTRTENQCRLYFLTEKIFQENKLSLTNQEINEEFQHQYLLSQLNRGMLDFSKEPKELVAEIRYYMTIMKAVDFLIQHAKNEGV